VITIESFEVLDVGGANLKLKGLGGLRRFLNRTWKLGGC